MNNIHATAYAKLNISLDVLGRRDDGYHEMRMIMQSATLTDDIEIKLTRDARFTVQSNLRYLPRDGRNIAAAAAKLFFERVGERELGAEVTLTKRIPVCAGLGGGSSDAAAVLLALNEHMGSPLSTEALMALGGELGSDVPFCVMGGTALATGRGEELTPLPPMPTCHVLIVKPPFPISTPKLFAELDGKETKRRPDTDGIIAALGRGDAAGVARRMYNVFEDVLPPNCGEIHVIRNKLVQAGALGACMSGTGSAVFGLFMDRGEAEAALRELRCDYRQCHLVETIN